MLLDKNSIFTANDIEYKDVDMTPYKWGGSIRIKTMSIDDQIEFERFKREKKDDDSLIIYALLSVCCVNEDGQRLFMQEDISQLQKKSSAAVLFLFRTCLDFNYLSEDVVEKQAKNS